MMLRIVSRKEVRYYIAPDGRAPILEWLEGLKDPIAYRRAEAHVNRLRSGLIGDWKAVGGGVFESRLNFGPGYRVYFAFDGNEILLLLCAGAKSSQAGDIMRARSYWKDYKERQYGEKK